jgi:hypothetical protein
MFFLLLYGIGLLLAPVISLLFTDKLYPEEKSGAWKASVFLNILHLALLIPNTITALIAGSFSAMSSYAFPDIWIIEWLYYSIPITIAISLLLSFYLRRSGLVYLSIAIQFLFVINWIAVDALHDVILDYG